MKSANQLNHSLQLNLEKRIHSSLEIVWEILTSPKYIKEYLYGTDVISDWKEGSSLILQPILGYQKSRKTIQSSRTNFPKKMEL